MSASDRSSGVQSPVGRIPAVDPAAAYLGLKREIDAAVERVLASGRYIGGPEVDGLERELATFCGVPHAVAVARRRGIGVIEDACQAHGARYRGHGGGAARMAGALGDAGCFSFYPTKNLGGCGEGGMVTTPRADVAERVRRLRDHGQSQKYV